MPRYRNLEKFLRVDKDGKEIPDWKFKVLKRKKEKWVINDNSNIEKEITYVKKLEQQPMPVKSKRKPKTRVQELIQHYEDLGKKIETIINNKNE